MRLIAFVLPFALLGCTQFPELDSAVSEHGQNAKYPALVPFETLLAQSGNASSTPEQTASTLSARVLALQIRAARLRGSVVDANTRKRMQNGVN